MKKVDKIVLKSFLGPFVITMLVMVFILLTQHMLKYFDDLVGKDLGWGILGQLIFYFAIFVTPFAFPLGVLLSSLMTFGNLGEHSELTAIKSGGISLPRTMRAIFFFIIFLTGFAFISNNYFVPKAALQAYSLMWDIKRKKPSLDLPEGEFYGGIENYRIRVEEKDKETGILRNVIIYDHTSKSGNKEVTIADSGRMSTIMGDRYLKLELYNGHSFAEGSANDQNVSRDRRDLKDSFSKVKFSKSEIIMDLSGFDMERTDKALFSRNRLMRNVGEINLDIDSLESKITERTYDLYLNNQSIYAYYFLEDSLEVPEHIKQFKIRKDSLMNAALNATDLKIQNNPIITEEDHLATLDSAERVRELARIKRKPTRNNLSTSKTTDFERGEINDVISSKKLAVIEKKVEKKWVLPEEKLYDSILTIIEKMEAYERPYVSGDMDETRFNDQLLRKIRLSKNKVDNDNRFIQGKNEEIRVFEIQFHKIIANSVACIIMFLIGAPLGSIIKKGGLGFPVLISILFFIIYYVLIIMGEKWAKAGFISSWFGIWQANIFLAPFGIYFLIQAQNDARLFDVDFYNVIFEKAKKKISNFVFKKKVFN